MMRLRDALLATLFLLFATAAPAQQRLIFDPEDFLDPRDHESPVFATRLVIGAAADLSDNYRSLHQDAGFVHLTNSFYKKNWQFDYKHSEIRGSEENEPVRMRTCGCIPPIYFPTPPSSDSTPAAPPPGRKDTLQVGFYWHIPGAPAEPPIMLRTRVFWSQQPVHTVITLRDTPEVVDRRYGHEQSFGLDTDTHLRLGNRDVWGSVFFTRTARSGTLDNRSQNVLAYTNRFPAIAVKDVLLRANLTVGGISGRGATGLNLINPYFEAFWHHFPSQANLHLIYSPQATRSGAAGWETHHQIALFVDRALFIKLFR